MIALNDNLVSWSYLVVKRLNIKQLQYPGH